MQKALKTAAFRREGDELTLAGDGKVGRRAFSSGGPLASQVLVRVEVVGICATDLDLFWDTCSAPHRTPICFGHEWSGVVEAVGPLAHHLRPGDRVTGECSLWCGGCDRCARNRNLCRHIEKFGITVGGAARDFVILDERYLHRAPPDLDPDVLALAEPLAVCHQALIAGGLRRRDHADQRMLIIGGGMLGQGCALLGQQMFNCDVLLHDIEPARRDRADALGLHVLADLSAATLGTDYADLYDDDPFDLVVETTGSASAFGQAISLVNPGGGVVLLGFSGSLAMTPKDLVLKAARLCGSIGGSGSFEEVVPWLADHAALARQMISHSFPAANVMEAFAIAKDRRQALKVQVSFA